MPLTARIPDIGNLEMVVAALFIAASGAVSAWNRLGLERSLLSAAVRCVLQLAVMGFALRIIFSLDSFLVVAALFLVMIIAAARIIQGNVAERRIPFAMPSFLSMFLVYALIAFLVSGVIIGADPWWRPRYFIPLAGMIAGNSMTALSLSLDRLFSDMRARHDEIEMRLCLGATAEEAARDILRDALKAGMIPAVNSLAGVGLVYLPGMMTGQILAGADPLLAIRYQMVVMFMITAATALTVTAVLRIVRGRCFGPGQRPVLRPGNH